MQHARHALPAHVHAKADLGHAHVGVAGHDPEIQRHRQRHAAADAKTLDGADGDLLHLLPGPRQPRSEFQVPAQRAEIHGLADLPSGSFRSKPALNDLAPPVSTTTEVVGVILKTAGGVGELAQRLRRQRIDAVAAVETHHRDAALGPKALLDVHKLRQRKPPCPCSS